MVNKSKKTDIFREVSLNIVGKFLDPEIVTKMLELKPDDFSKRGDIFGKNKKVKMGYWSLFGKPSSGKIETQIRSILLRIEHVKNKFIHIKKKNNIEQIYLSIAVEPNENIAIAGYCLNSKLINEFTSLGMDIAFSIHMPYYFGNK